MILKSLLKNSRQSILQSTRIDDVVYSVVRNTFGKLNYEDIISEKEMNILEICHQMLNTK